MTFIIILLIITSYYYYLTIIIILLLLFFKQMYSILLITIKWICTMFQLRNMLQMMLYTAKNLKLFIKNI